MRTNDEIIELMKELCAEKNISLSELARQTNMAKSGISRYFNKTRTFPLNRADAFAKALGVTPEFLLGVKPVKKEPDFSDLDLRDLAKSAKTFDGKPLNEEDIEAIENILDIYFKGRL
nr:MAG TPA: repressor protein [Caudoviricetes sp.]